MILFAAAETGSAKNLVSLINAYSSDKECVASGKACQVFDECSVDYIHDVRQIDFSQVDAMILGVGWCDGVDKDLLEIAHQKNIFSIGVVEHWTWFKHRFTINGQMVYPDYIVVNDNHAVGEAKVAGLPEDRLVALGNTVLEQLYRRGMPKTQGRWAQSLGIHQDREVISFISEQFKDDFLLGTEAYQGFDEFEVIDDLLKCMSSNQHLVIKMHPSEDHGKYVAYQNKTNVTIVGKTDVEAMISESDYLVGMGSMLLIEAAFVRDDVISYRPNEQMDFIGNKIGASTLIGSVEELALVLQGTRAIYNHFDAQRFSGSTDRILNFIQTKVNGLKQTKVES